MEEVRRSLEGRVSQAYIFGSVVSATAIPMESDLDLLIIPREGGRVEDFYKLLKRPHEMLLDRGLNLHIVVYDPSRHSPSLLREAKERGVRVV